MVEEKSYVDVNVFIYWLTADSKFGETALRWIEKVEDSPRNYVTSSLTLWEALVIIAGITGRNLRDQDLSSRVIGAITGTGISILDLRKEDFVKALDYQLQGMDMEDAIHLCVAKRAGCGRIVSNDRDFDRFIERVF